MRTASIRLHWIPLGAGGYAVRWSGRVFERCAARVTHRAPRDLVHAALEVWLDEERWTVEMAPAWAAGGRGAAVTGPVGLRVLGWSRLFRYEVRLWPGGVIPDLAEAVTSVVVATTEAQTRGLLAAGGRVPALTWGRDELGLGEMWTSNSVVAWLLATSGHAVGAIPLPAGARAPGWDAGCRYAVSGRADVLMRDRWPDLPLPPHPTSA